MYKFLALIFMLSFSVLGRLNIPNPDCYWTYKTVNGIELKLSVFLPDAYNEGHCFPTIAIFHGGSWTVGDPNMHYADCKYWSSRGMIAVSVSYRLKNRDKVEVPFECMKDAKSAIRFLRKNAKKLKVDKNKLVVAGGSAGGQLAASLSMIPDVNDDLFDLKISSRPNATILYNPWFKCKKEWSPTHNIVSGLPPMLIFSGAKDAGIPKQEMIDFSHEMRAKSNKIDLYIAKEGKHGFCNGRNLYNPFFYWALDYADSFLVGEGILEGKSTVKYPNGVKPLGKIDYKIYQ